MIDVLGLVYRYVKRFAWRNNDVPQYRDDQIIRGWQNTGTLPSDSAEFCVITLNASTSHGLPVNLPLVTETEYTAQFFAVTEHTIQIDFCSAEPAINPQVTKLRAGLLKIISGTFMANQFFKLAVEDPRTDPVIACLYADEVQDWSALDIDKLYSARYSLNLHLSETQRTNFEPIPSFDNVKIRTKENPVAIVEDVDVFHRN